MKELLGKITNNLTLSECQKLFKQIADVLMTDYAIASHGKIYRLLEIEFYYYNVAKGINDFKDEAQTKMVTYKRTTPAGQWFFHPSGIDLTFESDESEGYGGGILIRKIEDEEGKKTEGSLKCEWEIFAAYNDAFSPTVSNPHLIKSEHIDRKIEAVFRHNLPKDETRKWRYIVNA